MTFAETFLPEFDQEMAVTRRLLERVPDGKADWKPHPKSFSLAHLSQLVARMPGWQVVTLKHPSLDLSGGAKYSNESTATLLAEFDKGVADARAAIAATPDAALGEPWALTHGTQVLMTLPRGVVVRQNMSHLIHHRGQLTVYLRELDVPIPSIYGPTADEGWKA